MNEMQ